jgi:tetratricopeptide (TPR) repeat protein
MLLVTVFLHPARKERQDLYLKAVAEKNLETKMELLKEYVQKYGTTNDKFLRFIYLNLADTSYKLKNYDETIQYGEKALEFVDLDATNKLRLSFSLANSYNVTNKDVDKAFKYAKSIVDVCNTLIERAKNSEQDPEKAEQFISNYKKFFVAPALRIQGMILYNKGEIKPAADKAVEAFKNDQSEISSKMSFSLAVNLFKKGKMDDAINVVEQIIEQGKPKFHESNLLANAYYRKKNKSKAVEYFELAYKSKHKLDLAMRIGRLVHKNEPNKGLKYFADAFILTNEDKQSDAYRYLEQLYFNRVAPKDKSSEEKEKEFKAIINAAKARLNVETQIQETPTNDPTNAQN